MDFTGLHWEPGVNISLAMCRGGRTSRIGGSIFGWENLNSGNHQFRWIMRNMKNMVVSCDFPWNPLSYTCCFPLKRRPQFYTPLRYPSMASSLPTGSHPWGKMHPHSAIKPLDDVICDKFREWFKMMQHDLTWFSYIISSYIYIYICLKKLYI